jgi:hypothetical protein
MRFNWNWQLHTVFLCNNVDLRSWQEQSLSSSNSPTVNGTKFRSSVLVVPSLSCPIDTHPLPPSPLTSSTPVSPTVCLTQPSASRERPAVLHNVLQVPEDEGSASAPHADDAVRRCGEARYDERGRFVARAPPSQGEFLTSGPDMGSSRPSTRSSIPILTALRHYTLTTVRRLTPAFPAES